MQKRPRITSQELARWNGIRAAAGFEPIDQTLAEAVLGSVSEEEYEAIRDALSVVTKKQMSTSNGT